MKKSTHLLFVFSLTISLGTTYSQTTNNLLSPIGKVGIGTITPQSRLHVVGNTKIDSALTARSLNVMQLSTYQGDAIFQKRLGVAGLTVLDSVTIGGPIELPNVGDVPSTGQVMDVLFRDPITGGVFKGGNEALRSIVYPIAETQPEGLGCPDGNGGSTTPFNPYWVSTSGKLYTSSFCVPNIKVGIGTNNPNFTHHVNGNGFYETTLQVKGNASFLSSLQIDKNVGISTSPSTFSKFKIKNTNQASSLHIDNSTNDAQFNKLIFLEYTEPTTEIIKVVNSLNGHIPFLLDVDGSMTVSGIDRKLLQLNTDGLLQARKIRVDVEAWPDYVFQPNYSLLPLKELKTFINKNGHLPNIPSALTLETEGLDIEKTAKAMMEKIEELTLYLLEQNENIEVLKARVIELEKNN